MANYTISKRIKKKTNVNIYCARVRQKEKGVVTFSKSKTFHSKVAATKWAKNMMHKVEHNYDEVDLELNDCTLATLIDEYLNKKQKSTRPLGRTAKFILLNIKQHNIAKMLVSKIKSKDIVDYCIARKNSVGKPQASTLAIDISCIRKVLKVAKSIFSIRVNDQAVIDAYPALHDLNLIARSEKRERRLENNEFEQLLVALKEKENHTACLFPIMIFFYCRF